MRAVITYVSISAVICAAIIADSSNSVEAKHEVTRGLHLSDLEEIQFKMTPEKLRKIIPNYDEWMRRLNDLLPSPLPKVGKRETEGLINVGLYAAKRVDKRVVPRSLNKNIPNYDLLLKWLNGLPDTFPYVEKRETDSLINVGITADTASEMVAHLGKYLNMSERGFQLEKWLRHNRFSPRAMKYRNTPVKGVEVVERCRVGQADVGESKKPAKVWKSDEDVNRNHNLETWVHETVDFLSDLIEHWPKEWGEIKENSIGVVVPYTDQVHMLRNALRQRDPRLRNVAVERVNNVQGKEFRVIVINTVHTYHSCYNVKEEDADYGFLSNPKLLNTAITRAQSLVVIVGDPFSLCTVGKCRNLWIKFLEECHKHQSLHRVTFNQIQYYLDIMDIQKQYKLNPAAQSFIPKYAQQQQQQQQQIAASYAGQPLIQQQLTSTSQNLYPTLLQGSFSAVPVFQTNSYQQYAYSPTSSLQSIAGYPQAQLQSQYQTLNGTTFTAPVGSQLYNNQLSATNLMASPSTAASISVSLPQKTVVSQHMVVTNRTSSPPLDFLSDVMGDWKKFTTT